MTSSTSRVAGFALRALLACAAFHGAAAANAQTGPTPTCPNVPIASARGRVFHACDCATGAEPGCRPGNDQNNGRSPATAFRTYEQLRKTFGSAQAGDVFAFCRGGAFAVTASTRWFAPACRPHRPCVIRDYQPQWPATAKPQLIVPNADGRGFGFEDGGTAQHDAGYIVLGLSLRGPGSGAGVFLYNDVDDVMLCDLDIDGFALGVYVGGSNPPADASSDAKNARITLRSSRIVNNTQQGFLGSCEGCAIEYNKFENNGFERDLLLHHIYVSGDGRDERVVGNELYRAANVKGKCSAASLVVHGRHENLLIEGNVLREDVGAAGPGCWGIAVDTGYDKPEEFSNVTIRGNTLINLGNVGIGVNSCRDCLIEANVVVHEQPFDAILVAAPDRAREPNDAEMADVVVRNNLLYIAVAKGAGGTGIRLGKEGTGHAATGNRVRFSGPRNGRVICFDSNLPDASYTAIERNTCRQGPRPRLPSP